MAGTHAHHHSHHHAADLSEGRLKLSLCLTFGFVILEALVGLSAHSLALLSDAGHNFTDALALALAWYALWIARKPATTTKTYGYHRVGILTALFNAVTLLVIAVLIFVEAYWLLFHPWPVESLPMIVVPPSLCSSTRSSPCGCTARRPTMSTCAALSSTWSAMPSRQPPSSSPASSFTTPAGSMPTRWSPCSSACSSSTPPGESSPRRSTCCWRARPRGWTCRRWSKTWRRFPASVTFTICMSGRLPTACTPSPAICASRKKIYPTRRAWCGRSRICWPSVTRCGIPPLKRSAVAANWVNYTVECPPAIPPAATLTRTSIQSRSVKPPPLTHCQGRGYNGSPLRLAVGTGGEGRGVKAGGPGAGR